MIAWLKERLARANRMPVDPAVREAERRACRAHDEALARERDFARRCDEEGEMPLTPSRFERRTSEERRAMMGELADFLWPETRADASREEPEPQGEVTREDVARIMRGER